MIKFNHPIVLKLLLGIFCMTIHLSMHGQNYKVERCLFNTPLDELSPFFYNNSLYFSSNNKFDTKKKYTHKNTRLKRSKHRVLAQDYNQDSTIIHVYDFKGRINISSFVFHDKTKTGYFTVSKNVKNSHKSSKSSIFLSKFIDGAWSKMTAFEHNLEFNNLSNPVFSTDGNTLYFESDMAGGSGGLDIWYCKWQNDKWGSPINLGPKVNSSANERTPFVDHLNTIYFSSDKNKDKTGYDIYSFNSNSKLLRRLPAPINSDKDDLSYIHLGNELEGYLSSDRDHLGYDVFKFSYKLPENPTLVESHLSKKCFTFIDPQPFHDSLNLKYIWDFGDGTQGYRASTPHCYEQSGNYVISLTIQDELRPEMKHTVASKKLTVKENSSYYFEQKVTDKLAPNTLTFSVLPKPDKKEIAWELDSKLHNQSSHFTFTKAVGYGNHVIKAYFSAGSSNYALVDTVLYLPETISSPKTKISLLLDNNHKSIDPKALAKVNEVLKDNTNKQAVLSIHSSFSPETVELLKKQIESYNMSFSTKIVENIQSPFLEVYYE